MVMKNQNGGEKSQIIWVILGLPTEQWYGGCFCY
jgi:hypothetical protein